MLFVEAWILAFARMTLAGWISCVSERRSYVVRSATYHVRRTTYLLHARVLINVMIMRMEGAIRRFAMVAFAVVAAIPMVLFAQVVSISAMDSIGVSNPLVVAPGTANVLVGSYAVMAPRTGDVVITSVTIAANSGIANFTNLRITVGGNAYGSAVTRGLVAGSYIFSGKSTISAGTSAKVGVFADVLKLQTGSMGALTSMTGVAGTGRVGSSSLSLATNVSGQTVIITAIVNSPPSPVVVVSPNGGETLVQGQSSTVSWKGGTGIVELALVRATFNPTIDAPVGWIALAGVGGSVTWTGTTVTDFSGRPLPPVAPGQYKMLAVSQPVNGGGNFCYNAPGCNFDMSNAPFAVAAPSGTQPIIAVISPNGGERWQVGETHAITWKISSFPTGTTMSLRLSYQTSAGGIYEDGIASGLGATSSYQWTIPAKYGMSMSSTAFKVGATLVGGNVSSTDPPQDYSDASFGIGAPAAPGRPGVTASMNAAVGSQTVPAGSVSARISSFLLSASSSEAMRVNTISILTGSSAGLFRNLRVAVNGAQFGAMQSSLLNNKSYSFTGSSVVAAGGSVAVDVYVDVLASDQVSLVGTADKLSGCTGSSVTSNTAVSCVGVPVSGQFVSIAAKLSLDSMTMPQAPNVVWTADIFQAAQGIFDAIRRIFLW